MGFDADSRVAYANNHVALLLFRGQVDAPARLRVFRRVEEQIYEHLLKSHRVGLQPHRRVGKGSAEAVIALSHYEFNRLSSATCDCAQIHSFMPHSQLAATDA